MPVRVSDLQWRAIGGSNVLPTVLNSASISAMFAKLSGAGQRDGALTYRTIALVNVHPSLPLTSIKVYFSKLDTRGAIIEMGLDTTGVATLPNRVMADDVTSSAPATWSIPTTSAAGLSVASLGPGQAFCLWIRRRGAGAGATYVATETNTLTVTGTTAA